MKTRPNAESLLVGASRQNTSINVCLIVGFVVKMMNALMTTMAMMMVMMMMITITTVNYVYIRLHLFDAQNFQSSKLSADQQDYQIVKLIR